ncbi:hypothetical protein GB927_012685 [Shinella sp. CPCC 100929]|uniref:Uncharacterized protein n=1 Tax=Shinella lacus TaxID=2654216 RepID=A0ABT1R6V5_9HYPH|nr:hypothetical protein [Shinella lacus]MCQ4630902.1 hypothetical protein [Shinella lacus]
MNDVIPFFSDLDVRAIPAVQRLYDEAQEPGYSLPILYSNFISRLNSAGVAPPARKLVVQWLAAVKIGMAGRPEISAGIATPVSPLAPTPGYFENLPEGAMPALAAAWDAIQTAGADPDDADEKAFEAFFDAMRAIGHMEPSWRGFVAYAKAVRAGQVDRPARQIVEPDAIAQPAPEEPVKRKGRPPRVAAEPKVPSIVDAQPAASEAQVLVQPEALAADAFVPLTPQSFLAAASPEMRTPTDVMASQLHAIRDRMVEETIVQLHAEVRRKAEAIVAGQLRALADEMESRVAC